AALPRQSVAQIDARFDVGGLGSHRAPEQLLRVMQPSRILMEDAAHIERSRVARIEGDRAVEGSFCRLDLVSLARDRAQIVVCVGVGLETMRLLEGRGGVVDPLVFEQQYAEVQV